MDAERDPLGPPVVGADHRTGSTGACMSCGSHLATRWSTPDGPALLCRECAVLHGIGCP
jgi:hypothetical protein